MKPKIKYPLTREDYRKLRHYWKPDDVKVLFVAEAPPKDRKSYFFNHETGIGQGLFSYVTCGLGIRGKDKEKRLCEFKKRGFWLIDVFQEPIEDIHKKDVESHLTEFRNELKRAGPGKIVIVIPKSRLKKAWRDLVIKHLLDDYGEHFELIKIPKWGRRDFSTKLKELQS